MYLYETKTVMIIMLAMSYYWAEHVCSACIELYEESTFDIQ